MYKYLIEAEKYQEICKRSCLPAKELGLSFGVVGDLKQGKKVINLFLRKTNEWMMGVKAKTGGGETGSLQR